MSTTSDTQPDTYRDLVELLPDNSPLPDRLAYSSEITCAVHTALSGIECNQRDVLILRELHGLSHKDIATRLGITVNAVNLRLRRGRENLTTKLRELIGDSHV